MYGPRPAGHWTNSVAPNSGRRYRVFTAGDRYRVVHEFIDVDGDVHPVGEQWTFRGYSFVPYDDGLSLFVSFTGDEEWLIRLQDRPSAQSHIINDLEAFVAPAEHGGEVEAPLSDPQRVNDAILAFNDWDEPWRFREFVVNRLAGADAKVFERVWRLATDANRWRNSEMTCCVRELESEIRETLPGLTEETTRAIATAASYEWR